MKYCVFILLISVSLNAYARQDEYFDGFCRAFGALEHLWFEYSGYKTKDATDTGVAMALVGMTQQYHTLLRVYDEAAFKYRRSAAFDTMSRPHYLAVIDEAEVMLESDLTLRKMKRMVQAMVGLEREGFPRQYDDINNVLERLRFRNYYNGGRFDYTIEGYLLQKQLQAVEAYVFRRYFEPVIESLADCPAGCPQRAALKRLAENTHCEPCREKAVAALLHHLQHRLE